MFTNAGQLQEANQFCSVNKTTVNGSRRIYGLLTKRVVKMAGYWPRSFFASLWTETEVEVHKLAKNERGQYPAILTDQAWYYFFAGHNAMLPAWVANHSAGFASSFSFTELAIY